MSQEQYLKDIQKEYGLYPRSVRVIQVKRQAMIVTAAGVLPFVVFCLILLSGCQDNQKAAPQPESASISIKSEKVKQEERQDYEWYLLAAEQGIAEAQSQLGLMYSIGEGVKQDHKQAMEWYRKAAEQEYAEAQYKLGVMYAKGEGVKQDPKQAVEWFHKATEQGHKLAKQALKELGETP